MVTSIIPAEIMRANSLHSSPRVSNPVPGATFAAVFGPGDVSPIAAAISRLTHLWRSQWKGKRTVNPSGHRQWIYCVICRADLPGEMSRFFGVRLREKAWEEPKQTQSYTFLKLPEVTSSYCHLPRSHWLLRGWRGWWSASSLSLVSLLLTGDIFGLRTDWGKKTEHNIWFKALLPLYGVYLQAHDRTNTRDTSLLVWGWAYSSSGHTVSHPSWLHVLQKKQGV